MIFTTKHHSGWCNFPSKQHLNWNSKDSGPHLDLTANLTASVRAKGLKIGFYHSLKEWYNPLYEKVCVCMYAVELPYKEHLEVSFKKRHSL